MNQQVHPADDSVRCPNPMAWMLPFATLGLCAGILLGRHAVATLPIWLGIIAAALACLLGKGVWRRIAIVALFVAVGFSRGYTAFHPDLPPEGTYQVTGVVSDTLRLREDGQMRTLLRQVTLNGEPLSGGAYWTCYPGDKAPENLSPGDLVTFEGTVYHADSADNPGGFAFDEYLYQQGLTVGVYGMTDLTAQDGWWSFSGVMASFRDEMTQGYFRVMDEETGAYASAMILGDRTSLPEEDTQLFNRLGITHILSVSGYHVGVLAGILALLCKKLKLSPKLRLFATFVVLAAYCVLTGLHPPVIRATLLVLLFQVERIFHRQHMALHMLCLSAMVMLLISPIQLSGASFQLSYGAMLGLTLIYPALTRRMPKKKGLHSIGNAVAAAFSAQLGVMLPQLYWYHELPLLSIPANLVVMAFASLLLTLYWVVLAVLPIPGVSWLLGGVADWLTQGLLALLRFTQSMDGMMLWTAQANLLTAVGAVLILAGLSILWRKHRWIPVTLGVILVACSLSPAPAPTGGTVTYTQLSVGNADAAILQDGDMVVVIDTGEGDDLAQWLHQRRMDVDVLILTHMHQDHVGGVEALIEKNIPVEKIFLPRGAMDVQVDDGMVDYVLALENRGSEITYMGRGDLFTLPSGEIRFLWPDTIRGLEDANVYSLAMQVQVNNTTLLLTGDLDGAYEIYSAVPSDVLKVAHHGSDYSTGEDFLTGVSPQTAILSCGDDDRCQSLRSRTGDTPVYCTHCAGTVTITITPEGYSIDTLFQTREGE
ncbi:MAG: DNA internalization-related competence protein ComEC/Rec2 [Clostridiales bacterium]|nr:DNA internalization-related competence protein ComEC/Rec2 [Clostridiales bacterium]